MTASAYERLEAIFEHTALISNAERALAWDRRTLMPRGSGDTRARIIAALNATATKALGDPQVGSLLDDADGEVEAGSWQAANLREMRRVWRHLAAVPVSLQKAIAEMAGPTEAAWEVCRRENDFASFVRPLREYLALQVEASGLRGAGRGLDPYDALIDEHDPGLRTATIDPLFDDLASFLPDFLGRVEQKQARTPAPRPLCGDFPEDRQVELSRSIASRIGFDFERGRLDTSAHPYTSIVPGDIRITTRFRSDDVRAGLIATIHESGHAMYEAGLPQRWRFQPVGLARSGSLHESQALIFEMQAGRSAPFLRYLAERLRLTFGMSGPAWTDVNVLGAYRRILAGTSRADADEVTYPLHIILRYRIERQLIDGRLNVADLPEAWNAASRDLLGVTPATHAAGCLQDPHWVIGYIGYFPVYALGALIAAQLFAAAKRDEPALMSALAGGDFSPLLRWTRGHVHHLASFPPSGADIVQSATGETLTTRAFKQHLHDRYSEDAA